jgi:heavy metal sensor kinase
VALRSAVHSGRITRWLRFRLTISFVLFFALLLTGVGLLFRGILHNIQTDQVGDLLAEEWGAIRGFLAFEPLPAPASPPGAPPQPAAARPVRFQPVWRFTREDPEEALIVERLRHVCLIADEAGVVLEVSPQYRLLGIESEAEIRDLIAANAVTVAERWAANQPFLVRSGVVIDSKRVYFVAIGRSLAENRAVLNRFTTYYFASMPLILAACGLLGWFVSKRALVPVTELAARTEAVSGDNLSMRLPLRGAGDELDHLIANFNQMVERLEESFRQTRQFSTDVSHELRTPLTVVRGHLEVALMTARNEDQYREAILTALQEVERLSNTVRALLHLSQAESGQLKLRLAPLDLSSIAAGLMEQFQIVADSAQIRLTGHFAPSVPVAADRVQMERLISNLVSNAIKYTPAGGRVDVTVQVAEGAAELLVADTGQGIAAGVLPYIFDRFYRAPELRGDPDRGLGLGLSFVAWIVRAHHGTIDVESEVGKGSRFRVRFRPEPPGAAGEARTEALDGA